MRAWFWLAPLLWLAGCATLGAPETPLGSPYSRFELAARLSVVDDREGFAGAVRWRHAGGIDEVLLLSPLGQGVARLDVDGAGARLVAADGRSLSGASAESLTENLLGWRFPLGLLRWWLAGEAAPGAVAGTSRDAAGRLASFEQAGWRVDLARGEAGEPVRLALRRDGLRVRLVVDDWRSEP